MPSNARNLANLLGAGETTISAEKLGSDVAPGTEDYSSIDSLGAGTIVGETAFVEGSNRLYIWNGSGWYNIALINTTPTWDSNGQPASSYELDADSPQDATVITLAASDPEGLPISYNYITSGSMDSIATISQDSSVFTITPKTSTQVPDGGTGSITFRATDGVNILPQVSSFTLNFITIVTNSKYTTLLVTATGTSDNNNITDTSTNNHTITVNGDAYAGTFSPYRSGGYSMYFDGSDYVDLGNGNLAINTEDFTIETWVNVTLGSNMSIANNSNWSAGDNTGWRALITAGGLINLTASQGSWNAYPSIYASTNAIPSNEWAHVVICRASGVISSYINGIKDPTTVNYSASLNQTGGSSLSSYSLIGAYIADGSEYNNLTGYLSDFHFKLGSAKYTTTFSPPTERLTVESGTDVLLFNKPFLKDESTNAYTISINGDPKIKPFSPYDYNKYDAADHGGSVYTSGTESLGVSSFSSFSNIGTGDYTLECWHYNDTANSGVGLDFRDAAGIALVSSSGSLRAYYVTGALFASTATGVVKPRQWNHLVFCRISGILKGYLNGKEVFSVNDTTNLSGSSNTVYIGNNAAASSALNGYYSSVRMTNKGVYTGEFTPPTTPLSTTQSSGTNISAVASGECKLLVKGTDASIIDKSQNGNLELNGNVTGSTTQVKFANTKSTYFPGSLGDQIIATSGENVDLSSADPFTWEAWCYFNSVSGVIHLMTSEDAGYTQDRIAFELRNSKLSAMFGGTVIQSGSQVLSTGQWYHLAISRAVGSPYTTTRFFVNGNLDQTSSGWQQAVAIGNFDKWYIGSPTTNGIGANYNEFNGYMQDVRFTEGLTRYTANFTPPTAPLEG